MQNGIIKPPFLDTYPSASQKMPKGERYVARQQRKIIPKDKNNPLKSRKKYETKSTVSKVFSFLI